MIGVSFGFHDAAVSAIIGDQIVYAAHSERFSRKKNDRWLNGKMLDELIQYGVFPSDVVYYEKPWLKSLRQFKIGQQRMRYGVKQHIADTIGPHGVDVSTVGHHHAHAAAGYYTSPFSEAAVVVVDAIGEFDTMSVWEGRGRSLRKIWSQRYPHSLGLLYSAFTQRVGLKPNEEEYILMGMAAYGEPIYANDIIDDFIGGSIIPNIHIRKNVHKGIGHYKPEARNVDLAASIQAVMEALLLSTFEWAAHKTGMKNVCYQGGVALNCVANTEILRRGDFDNYWIMPNAGDAGASLGAVLAKKRDFVEFKTPALGTNIEARHTPSEVADGIIRDGVIGLAQGRAEFGPRAFGNRSLLADPRSLPMKDKVNEIKKREKFRPFAPMILSEYVDDYFETLGADLRYMQYAVQCKRPKDIPAAIHVDGTSRVQTVGKNDGYIRNVLEQWHRRTGCPVLVNTSLNIRGEPLVNDVCDADKFAATYNINVM